MPIGLRTSAYRQELPFARFASTGGRFDRAAISTNSARIIPS